MRSRAAETANANHGIMRTAVLLGIADCVRNSAIAQSRETPKLGSTPVRAARAVLWVKRGHELQGFQIS